MIKRKLIVVVLVVLGATLAGCGGGEKESNKPQSDNFEIAAEETEKDLEEVETPLSETKSTYWEDGKKFGTTTYNPKERIRHEVGDMLIEVSDIQVPINEHSNDGYTSVRFWIINASDKEVAYLLSETKLYIGEESFKIIEDSIKIPEDSISYTLDLEEPADGTVYLDSQGDIVLQAKWKAEDIQAKLDNTDEFYIHLVDEQAQEKVKLRLSPKEIVKTIEENEKSEQEIDELIRSQEDGIRDLVEDMAYYDYNAVVSDLKIENYVTSYAPREFKVNINLEIPYMEYNRDFHDRLIYDGQYIAQELDYTFKGIDIVNVRWFIDDFTPNPIFGTYSLDENGDMRTSTSKGYIE